MTTLLIDAGPAAPDALVTRTGGIPLAPAGTEWPACSSCEGPLQFLALVVLDDLDGPPGGAGAPRRGVLALFACQNDPGMCDDWDPLSGGNRALLLPADGLTPMPLPDGATEGDEDGEAALLLGATHAVRQVAHDEPSYDRARTAWAEQTGRPLRQVMGQLGGSPDWLQADETPACEGCTDAMRLVVQLEEGPDHRTAMNFGGGGSAYAFACEPCRRAVFLWQC